MQERPDYQPAAGKAERAARGGGGTLERADLPAAEEGEGSLMEKAGNSVQRCNEAARIESHGEPGVEYRRGERQPRNQRRYVDVLHGSMLSKAQ